jgi:tRNA dimethylallyltransferase
MRALPSKKVIAVVGPTATGKSDFAVELARVFDGEIVSADSRQIYRGMDLGTGKIMPDEMHGIPHHLLSFTSPNRKYFSVAQYTKRAHSAISDILSRGKLPIIVGGTGFYIDALTGNLKLPDVPPNLELRKTFVGQSADALFSQLQKLDPERASRIDPKNRVRLIRALEIFHAQKAPFSVESFDTISKKINGNAGIEKKMSKASTGFETLFLGLNVPDPELDIRIKKRMEIRFKNGMIAEVQNLHAHGVSWKKLEYFGLEYRFIAQFLQNKITREQLEVQLFYAIRHYAKRQRTWFKRNKNIIWLPANKKTSALRIAKAEVAKFLKAE